MWSNIFKQRLNIGMLEALLILIGILAAVYIIKLHKKEIEVLNKQLIEQENNFKVKELKLLDSISTYKATITVKKQDSLINAIQEQIEHLKNKDYVLSKQISNINKRIDINGKLPIFE
jgi:hypothetical protein